MQGLSPKRFLVLFSSCFETEKRTGRVALLSRILEYDDGKEGSAMSDVQVGQVIGQYDALRRKLVGLQDLFSYAAANYPPVYSQLISPLDGPLSAPQWDRFVAVNSRPGGDWQDWEVFPDKRRCARIFGDSGSLSGFHRTADDGCRLLRQVKRLEEDGKAMVPAGLLISLPPYDGYLAWLYLLYKTAASGCSDSLRAEPGFWGRTGQVRAEDADEWSPSAGIVVPVHPFYEELPDDLFLSSARAIGLWLEAEAADLPIILPPEPNANGPARPDRFWLDGCPYGPFGEHEMLLLECLWGRKEGVHCDNANDYVYGVNAGGTKLKSLYKNVNAKFRDFDCLATISLKNQHFTLEVFKVD
jgi:hypothetical protein